MARAAESGELALERSHLGTEDELTMRQYARDGILDSAAEPAALRGNIDERDRPFVDSGELIHGAIFTRIFGWRMILSENRYPLFGIMR
jgi:hypothetical protein